MNAEALFRGLPIFFASLDLSRHPDWDLTHVRAYSDVHGAIVEGLVDFILAGRLAPLGLACVTARAARPPTARSRSMPWGLRERSASSSARGREANLCAFRSLSLMEAVVRRGGGHFLEHPRDPGVGPFPSLWTTEEFKGV